MARNRDRRKANERRRAEAATRQVPLPPEEQDRRHQERLADYQARYPRPPAYRTHLGDDSLRDVPKPTTVRVRTGRGDRPHFPLFDFFLALRAVARLGR